MAKKSVIYHFTRDERSITGFMSTADAASAADAVVRNWAEVAGRSFQTMVDDEDTYIAHLTYDDEQDPEPGADLDQRCRDKGLIRQTIPEMQSDKPRA